MDKRTSQTSSAILNTVLLILIMSFLIFPLLWVLMTSFKSNMEAYRFPPTFFPADGSLRSYIDLFTVNNTFFIYYKNNFLVSGICMALTTLLAIFSGHVLSRFKFNWNKFIVAAFMTSQMFPVISRLISLYGLLGKAKLINTIPGLVLAIVAAQIPFTVVLMSSFFDAVPIAIDEAARIDGASRMQILFNLEVPLVKPGILSVAIYSFLLTWDDYLHAATLIQDDKLRTLSAGIALRYLGELSYDWSLINTISIVGTVPMVILFFFFQKYMIKGLVAGAVKG